MGRRNYLVEGVSGTGKTTVCDELRRRGHHAVHGDRELAYQGDPRTGVPLAGSTHDHHIWDVAKVEAMVAAGDTPATFFCGGSRNVAAFVGLFDEVFVLTVDAETLARRLDERSRDPDEWHPTPADRARIERLHRTGEGLPAGTPIDATRPVAQVVDSILEAVGAAVTDRREPG